MLRDKLKTYKDQLIQNKHVITSRENKGIMIAIENIINKMNK